VIDRRRFIGTLTGGLLAAPLAVEAQRQVGSPARVGVLLNLYAPNAEPPQALRQRLRDLGYAEGRTLVIDWSYQLGGSSRLPALAAELVSLKPNVIVADVAAAIRAAMRATSTVPIVMAASADAVGGGLVASLGRPGGNVTRRHNHAR
jgi:putative ABC transport system substrate-binding protein